MFQVGEKIFVKPNMQDDTIGIQYYFIVKDVNVNDCAYELELRKHKTDELTNDYLGWRDRRVKGWVSENTIINSLRDNLYSLSEKQIYQEIIERHKKKILDEERIIEAWKGRVNKRIEKLEAKIKALP
jgi:uncharacterized protein YbcI